MLLVLLRETGEIGNNSDCVGAAGRWLLSCEELHRGRATQTAGESVTEFLMQSVAIVNRLWNSSSMVVMDGCQCRGEAHRSFK